MELFRVLHGGLDEQPAVLLNHYLARLDMVAISFQGVLKGV